MRLRQRQFAELVERQLLLFEEQYADLIRDCEAALRAYNEAPADESEERYGDFVDLVDTGRDTLEDLRDTYAQTLDAPTDEVYRLVFNELTRKRYPRFGFELD